MIASSKTKWAKIIVLGLVIWGLSLFQPEVNLILPGPAGLIGWPGGFALAVMVYFFYGSGRAL